MEMDVLLNILFAAVISGLSWWIKSQKEELERVRILLNRTREEYVTKNDSNTVFQQIMGKFDRLEEKIDRLMER
jgi:Tfp pilus assembly protein PilO